MINNSQLVPRRAIYNIIGCICRNPKLIRMDGVQLTDKDFEEKFYKIIFASVNNLTYDNTSIKKITAVDIDNYLAQNPQLYKIYEDNKGFDFVNSAIKECNEDLFSNNYEVIKKFSLLRDFNNQGFDVSEILNPNSLDLNVQNKQIENFEKMDLGNIIEHFKLKFMNIQNNWSFDSDKRSYDVSEGLDTLLEDLRKKPDYGYPFLNRYYNNIFMGMKYGKLMIKSAGTGVGKTRTALMDIVSISASHIFNLDTNQYEENGAVYASTFISTELDIRELQTCLLAIISGVNEKVIKEGNYSDVIEKRILMAVEILKRSPITLHYISDFSINDIEQIIEKDILEKNSKYVFFDYLQITPKLSRTIQEEYGMGLREDQIMLNFTSRLKRMAEVYNVYISTATQLNRNSNDREARDASAIRGGSSTIDKADHAIQLYKVTKRDLDSIDHLLRNRLDKPNFMHIIYKNRSGDNNLIIWSIMNHGNMREKILFVTNMNFELVDIKPIGIQFE